MLWTDDQEQEEGERRTKYYLYQKKRANGWYTSHWPSPETIDSGSWQKEAE